MRGKNEYKTTAAHPLKIAAINSQNKRFFACGEKMQDVALCNR
jgi:hypothetical protein